MDKIKLICFLIFNIVAIEGNGKIAKEVYEKLLVNYEKEDPPSLTTSTEVRLGMYFESIHDVDNGEAMQMSSNFYLRQTWRDPRLSFNASEASGLNRIRLPAGARREIWLPDTYFRNQVAMSFHETTNENVFIAVASSGNIFFITHVNLVTSCPMDLEKFPFDQQICRLTMESYKHPTQMMYYTWLDIPQVYKSTIELSDNIKLPGYTITDTLLHNCTQNLTEGGSISCLEVQLVLQRNKTFYFVQYFLPTMLLVIMSWFSFWMNTDKYSERIHFLLLLALLVLIEYAIINNKVVQVSYVKASDVWMLLCLLFVFLAMLEATIIKGLRMNVITQKAEVGDDSSTSGVNVNTSNYAMCMGMIYSPGKVTSNIDIISRIMFPVLYLIAMVIFFTVQNS